MALSAWNIDPSHSAIAFSVRHMVVSKTRGRFTKWSGQLRFDAENPASSSVEVSIDPNDPAAAARYGITLVALAQRRWPVPWFDNSYTRAQLDYQPMPLRPAMAETVDWLRRLGHI